MGQVMIKPDSRGITRRSWWQLSGLPS